jgi:uncharacterized repeat protein (TIGR02543 family)
MDSNKSITAMFAVNTYTLSVTSAGNGSVTKNPDQPSYNHGTTVELTAVPAAGYHFVGWSGDAGGADNPLTVTMGRDKTITATFAINAYTLSVTSAGNGSVTKNPDQPSYNHGTTVELTAVPAAGYHFVSWSGDANGTANPLAVLMDGNKSITATFAINTYTLSVTSAGNGSVTKNPDQPSYIHGTTVELTAVPAAGNHFVGWSGDAGGAANPLALLMDSNKSITATFAINAYTLSVTSAGNGAVTKAPDQPTYNHGTAVTLTAVPAAGNHFVGWSGDAGGATNPLALLMDSNKSITATFAINAYTLSVTSAGNGSVTKNPDQPSYNHGTTVTLTAVPAAGNHFVGWSGDANGTANPLTVAMDSNKSITAMFAVNTYTLSVTSAGNGSVTKSPDQASYDHGTTVELTAVPAAGYHFVNWSGDANGAANPLALLMDGSKSITATFAINTYTITASAGTGGSISPSGAVGVNDGASQAFTITAGACYAIADVLVDGVSAGAIASYTFNNVTADHTIAASFTIKTFTITASAGAGGSISPNGAVAVDCGTNRTFSITALSGYAIGNVLVDLVPQGAISSYTFTNVAVGHTISASFVSAGTVSVGAAPGPVTLATDRVSVPVTITRSSSSPAVMAFAVTFTVSPPLMLPSGKASISVGPYLNADGGRAVSFLTIDKANGVYQADGTTLGVPCGSSALSGTLFTIRLSSDALGGSGTVVIDSVKLRDCTNGPITATVGNAVTTVLVDRSAPIVTVAVPNGGETWYVGEVQTISWTGSDPEGIASYDVAYSTTGGAPYTVLGTVPGTQTTYPWTVPATPSSTVKVQVTAHGVNGNVGSDASDGGFAIAYQLSAAEAPVTTFALEPVWPNPGHGSARFRFAVPREAHVRLSVLDVQGREVAVLVEGVQSIGRHTVEWNGPSDRGATAPGLYLVRFVSPGGTFVRRLAIVR